MFPNKRKEDQRRIDAGRGLGAPTPSQKEQLRKREDAFRHDHGREPDNTPGINSYNGPSRRRRDDS